MEGQCNFFVLKKKRLCRMTVRPGAIYCGEHLSHMSKEDADKSDVEYKLEIRIPCPLDPKHTCFASKLEKHLQVCNAREKDLPSYIFKNCNVALDSDDSSQSDEKRTLSDVPEDTLRAVIATVENIYNNVIDGNIVEIKYENSHPSVEKEINNALRKDSSKRHLVQTSALLNIIEDNKLLIENTCFVELGAGKGQVSYYMANASAVIPKCSVLLIDRASHRHKRDNKLDKEVNSVARVRADISDLVLSEVPIIKTSKNVVGVSKHLCGVATDLALRCLTNPNILHKTNGIIMATCCHHRCLWNAFVGKDFLKKHSVDQQMFNVICGLVSWATCGTGLSRERRAQLESESNAKSSKKAKYDVEEGSSEDDEKDEPSNDSDGMDKKCDNKKNLGLSLEDRAKIGYKAKAILDWGRAMYLRGLNYNVKLCFYVERNISPENVCIIATKS